MSREVAMSCARCGHIRGAIESEKKCGKCGLEPARWTTAPVEEEDGAVVAGTAEPPIEHTDTPHPPDPAELFATSPPGTEGYEPNPELKVRR